MTLSQQFITQKAKSKAVHWLSKKGGKYCWQSTKTNLYNFIFHAKNIINIGYLKLATFEGNERKLFIVQIN